MWSVYSSGATAAEDVFEGVNDVDDVVAGAFDVADEVHVVDAGLVFIAVFVDVVDVAAAQEVSHVVDFAFLVVGGHQVGAVDVFDVVEGGNHESHGFVKVFVERVDVVVDFFGELDVAFLFAEHDFADTIAAVGYALDFADDVEHTGDFELTFV